MFGRYPERKGRVVKCSKVLMGITILTLLIKLYKGDGLGSSMKTICGRNILETGMQGRRFLKFPVFKC